MSAPPASALSVEVLLRVADGKYGLFPSVIIFTFYEFHQAGWEGRGGRTGALAPQRSTFFVDHPIPTSPPKEV